MLPIVATLISSGLSLLGNAVMAKGKSVVEEKLGVKLDEMTSTPEGLLELKKLELDHEKFLVDAAGKTAELDFTADVKAAEAITERWQADISSDSWMAKNIRPMVLAWLTVFITIMAFGSHWLQVDVVFVELLKVSYGLVLTAYFLGRTIEKHKTFAVKNNV